ncbi:MAG: hypothetical protein QY323_00780 [Patescibacteria group bacterium]|nr:MAG: hypothetical protein QY323_00780 [Patescibacteria group bacterium]
MESKEVVMLCLPWYFVLAMATLALLRLVYRHRALRRERRIEENLVHGVFYHREMKRGQKIWCRTVHGYVYEIAFLEVQKGCRLYQIRKVYLDDEGRQCFEPKPQPFTFRQVDIRVGERFVCAPAFRSAVIVEISLRILYPTRAHREESPSIPPTFPPLRVV